MNRMMPIHQQLAFLALVCITLCFQVKNLEASGWTHQRPDGNRMVSGAPMDLSEVEPLEIQLSGIPVWLVSETFQNGVLWVAVLADGNIESFKVANGIFQKIELRTRNLPLGMPPLLYKEGSDWNVWSPPEDASPWTHGVILKHSNGMAYIDRDGCLVFKNKTHIKRLKINAMLDARLLIDENDRILLLTQPTDRYAHGVLGDRLEAESFTLIETKPEIRVLKEVTVGSNEVIEGLAPIWADIDGDGAREIIVTISAPGLGASLRVYSESGDIMAESSAVGRSFRWRNQATVFDPDGSGKLLLTDVLTPHIGGTLEFFEWKNQRLELVSSLTGFTSHQIGSRNLDLALAGPYGGTGKQCMILPSKSRGTLHAVGLVEGMAKSIWSQRLNGVLSSNLSAAHTPSGKVTLGLGTTKGLLRIWQKDDETPYLELSPGENSNATISLLLHGKKNDRYVIESSNDLINWESVGDIQLDDSQQLINIFPSGRAANPQTFFRSRQTSARSFADVQSVKVVKSGNTYRFQVTVSSPDTGCNKYADWWEILTVEGELLTRRILLHSHVNEQPFTRSGELSEIDESQILIIRAHMNTDGYGGQAMIGSIQSGFEPALLFPGFGKDLETQEPLPSGCAF